MNKENKDVCQFPGGVFKIAVYRNKKEAGVDLASKIKKFLGFKVVLGTPLQVVEQHNKMTNASLAAISGLMGNTGSQNPFTYLALGTSNTAVSAAHTALQAEIVTNGLQRVSATVSRTTTNQTNDTLVLTKTFTATGTSAIEEIGILNASSVGVMLARALTGTINVVNGNTLVATYSWVAVGN